MKFAVALAVLASPAAAHTTVQAHLHSDGPEGLMIGLALIALCGVALLLSKARK